MTRIGFVGLGAMGTPMARNLLRAGHPVAVYARRRERVTALASDGATACDSPASAAQHSDIIVTMVTDTAAVEEVTLGPRGIIEGASPGAVVIDHSTIASDGARRIADSLATRGIHMLDAPVSGGVAGAEAGTLVMMIGGDEDVFKRVSPVMSVNAQRLVYMGPSGAGQIAKACNQICIVVNQLGVAEALMVGTRAGLDPARLIDALSGGFAASRVLEMQGPKMASGDFTGRIESRLHHKDILLALDLAATLGLPLEASGLAAEYLGALQQAGGAILDSAAVITVMNRHTQTSRIENG